MQKVVGGNIPEPDLEVPQEGLPGTTATMIHDLGDLVGKLAVNPELMALENNGGGLVTPAVLRPAVG